MAEIILSRYERFTRNRYLTHFTTNLAADEIEERYGPRVLSRLREMCNLIAFPPSTPDKRKQDVRFLCKQSGRAERHIGRYSDKLKAKSPIGHIPFWTIRSDELRSPRFQKPIRTCKFRFILPQKKLNAHIHANWPLYSGGVPVTSKNQIPILCQ